MVQYLEDCSLSSQFCSCCYFSRSRCCFYTHCLFFLAFFSLFLMAIFEACRSFVSHILDVFLEPSHCLSVIWKVFAVFVSHGNFSLFLSAIPKASCSFCRLSRKLLTVFVSRLRSFCCFVSVLAVFKASCCFSWLFLLFQLAVLAVS